MMEQNHVFFRKFGRIFRLVPDATLVFQDAETFKVYKIPKTMSEKDLEKIMEESCEQDRNLLFDHIKKREIKFDENVLY